MKTSRQLVNETLEFNNSTHRVPRQMWTLPWATSRYPDTMQKMRINYPNDIVEVPSEFKSYGNQPKVTGGWFDIGDYVDEWGCTFTNIHDGIVGEVKQPIVTDEQWHDISKVHFPEELLTIDIDKVNAFCASTDQFVLQSDLARPFERMQFIRGTENLLVDFALKPKKMFDFMAKMHDFYCRLLELWAKTDVDGLFFMDDWGTQRNLLINPKMWVEVIKPMYKDYADIAKKHKKKIFFHSDGYTLDIIPHLIEIGVDAANLQIFCMGIDKLEKFKGRITFWGEIDRQGILPNGTKEDVEKAVKDVYNMLWNDGGLIAQCEFGPGANPDNVYRVFETWNKMQG
jgi:uroporphyrinogen decarboxylase